MIMYAYNADRGDGSKWESAFPVGRFHCRWIEHKGAECLMIDYDLERCMWPKLPWPNRDSEAVTIQGCFGPGDRCTVTDWDGNELLRYPRVQQ